MICMDFNKRFVDKWLCSRWYMRDFFCRSRQSFFCGKGPSSRSTTLLLDSSALVAAIGNHFFMKWVKGQERSRQTNEHVSMSVKEPLINYSPNSHIIRDAVHSKVCLSVRIIHRPEEHKLNCSSYSYRAMLVWWNLLTLTGLRKGPTLFEDSKSPYLWSDVK